MIELAREAIQSSWSLQDFDHLALAYFNLNDRNSPQYLEFHEGHEEAREDFFWDLASVTKVLTMGALALKEPKLFSEEERLLLEHRGGLPRWAILGKKSWKETVLKFSNAFSNGSATSSRSKYLIESDIMVLSGFPMSSASTNLGSLSS